MRAHTFELAFAAGSALFGGLAFLVALLAATTTRSETESAAGTVVVTTEHHAPGFEWLAAIALTLVALLLVWLVVAATLHAQLGIIRTSAALWVPALVLTCSPGPPASASACSSFRPRCSHCLPQRRRRAQGRHNAAV